MIWRLSSRREKIQDLETLSKTQTEESKKKRMHELKGRETLKENCNVKETEKIISRAQT